MSNYDKRKAARMNGAPVPGRFHEPPPWYTLNTLAPDRAEDPRNVVERELSAFGRRARALDAERRKAKEASALPVEA